jgi:hypothetical protein
MARASDVESVDLVVTVSFRALVARIDRKLQKSGRRLRADRRGGAGRRVTYIVIDLKKRAIVERKVDLAKLAHRLEVLEPWERAPQMGV